MKILENKVSVNFMIWETNEKKRNTNNVMKLYQDKKNPISIGDLLIGTYSPERVSVYTVESIESSINGNVKGKDYLTIRVSWENRNPSFFKGLLTDENSKTFFNLCN